jgi:hypothetical protein
MTQHPIDLLPDFVRIECQRGVRTGRYITAIVAAVVIIVIATTHARFELDRSRERFSRAEEQANVVLQLEWRAAHLASELEKAAAKIELHEALSLPLESSRLIATLINHLPESVTIERLDFDTARRQLPRTPARNGQDVSRQMGFGELSGFAASDDHVGELVGRMESSNIFHAVTWDYSRSRTVRELPAREFRVTFTIDLDEVYEIVSDHELDETAEAVQTHTRAIDDRQSAIGNRQAKAETRQPTADSQLR